MEMESVGMKSQAVQDANPSGRKESNNEEKSVNSWIEYWNSENTFDHFAWQLFADIFAKSTESILNYSKDDTVLDIGCGPGCLAASLKGKIKEFHGLEASQRYLDMARKRFRHEKDIFFHNLDRSDYTNLSFLKGRLFSKIICLSVIQYYDSTDRVEKLIEEVRNLASPGALFIIADIVSSTSRLSDVLGFLEDALKNKRLFGGLRFMISLRLSDYGKLVSSRGILTLSVEKMYKIIENHNLNSEVLSAKLTVNENRKHMLIRF